MKNISCDLAIEAKEMYSENAESTDAIPGVEAETEEIDGYISITRVKILNQTGADNLGKDIGTYISIEMPNRYYDDKELYEKLCKVFSDELSSMTEKILTDIKDTVLVVGLGNWNITADALGPKVISSIAITRHLTKYIPEHIDEDIRPVCGISPGVLGITGIETAEIVRGIVDKVKPKLVIAIDALCSKKMERINTTVQLASTGITPGEGVGNKRFSLSEKTIGVPVIAIGVPTVVSASTIASDTIDMLKTDFDIKDVPHAFSRSSANQSINSRFGDFIVAPKDVDTIIDDLSEIMARGINLSLHSI